MFCSASSPTEKLTCLPLDVHLLGMFNFQHFNLLVVGNLHSSHFALQYLRYTVLPIAQHRVKYKQYLNLIRLFCNLTLQHTDLCLHFLVLLV